MKNEVKDFKRKRLFDIYDERTNPFLFITTKIDITNIVNHCKKYKNNYATIAYFISLVANEMDCFKYRKENGKIYKYDNLRVSIVQMFNPDDIGFVGCNLSGSYKDFINEYKEKSKIFLETNESTPSEDEGEVWVSCEPWFEFTSLIPPFDKSITIPQFIWSKFLEEDNRFYTNLMIMVHHGFADGNHIRIFLEKLNDKINRFDEIVNKEV